MSTDGGLKVSNKLSEITPDSTNESILKIDFKYDKDFFEVEIIISDNT